MFLKHCHKQLPIGLDINSSYIALVELQRINNNTYALLSYVLEQIPEENNNESAIKSTLQKILQNTKLSTNKVVMALPYSQVQHKTINIPSTILKTTTIENFLRLNSENLLDLDINNNYFDYYLAQPEQQIDKTIISVNVVSAKKESVDKLKYFINGTPLQLVSVDINSYALLRATSTLQPNLVTPYIVAHIDKEKLLLGRVVNKQFNYVTETNLPLSSQKNYMAIAQYILEQIALTIDRTERMDCRDYNHTILLSGFHASPDLMETIKQQTKNEVLLINPLQKIHVAKHIANNLCQEKNIINQMITKLTLSFGLALHGGGNARY